MVGSISKFAKKQGLPVSELLRKFESRFADLNARALWYCRVSYAASRDWIPSRSLRFLALQARDQTARIWFMSALPCGVMRSLRRATFPASSLMPRSRLRRILRSAGRTCCSRHPASRYSFLERAAFRRHGASNLAPVRSYHASGLLARRADSLILKSRQHVPVMFLERALQRFHRNLFAYSMQLAAIFLKRSKIRLT